MARPRGKKQNNRQKAECLTGSPFSYSYLCGYTTLYLHLPKNLFSQYHTICFNYFSPKGESERTVEPYHLVFHWSVWYVWGWCELQQDFRLFKQSYWNQKNCGIGLAF